MIYLPPWAILVLALALTTILYLLINQFFIRRWMARRLLGERDEALEKAEEKKRLLRQRVVIQQGFFKRFNWFDKRRLRRFSDQLPDVVQFLASCLRSGYSLTQTLHLVVEEGEAPAAEELNRVIRDINLGKTYEEAFDELIARNPIEDLEIMTSAILISKETGGNLAEILDTVAHTMREKARLNGEIQSLTAQGRLSGKILILLPVALFLFLWSFNPDYIDPLFSDPYGRGLLILGVFSQGLGALLIKKIVTIDW